MGRAVITTLAAVCCLLTGAVGAPVEAAAAVHSTAPASASHGSATGRCALPAQGTGYQRRRPDQVGLRPQAVRRAVQYAQTHLRASVQIFRYDCLVAQGALDPVTDGVQNQLFSVTKSVISLLAGIAYDQGKIRLDDPVGKYLPASYGDAAHRAITIRQLLTETAGLRESIFSEFLTVGTDPDIAQEAMAQPLEHRPGTHFEYGQRTPDLLSAVLQRAVGESLQTYAQRFLFGLIGIPRESWTWLQDRAGQSYGYANLFMPPAQLAKLGLLAQHLGSWRGHRVVSRRYLRLARANSPRNPCYGFLFWHNGGSRCTSANVPDAQTVPGEAVPSAPRDMFAMVGALQQNNFMSPRLHLTITWTGTFGDTAPNAAVLLSASSASDLYYRFFRILMRGVRDTHVRRAGPYHSPPVDLDVNPFNYLDPRVLLSDAFPNSHCTILRCQ